MRTVIASICALLVGCGNAGGTEDSDAGASGSSSAGEASSSAGEASSSAGEASSSAASTTGGAEAGSSGEDDTAPASCDVAMPLAPGDYERTLEHDGVTRRYFLHVSPSSESAAPLVVDMHGYLSGAVMQAGWSRMNEAAEPRGIVTAHPEGLDNSWNAGSCCGESATNGVDDVGFIRAMVADVARVVCVDPRRVYATGLSNGGYMSNRLACEASDLFAAIAPVVGAMVVAECNPERAVPVLAFNGVQDPLVAYADGVSTIERWVEIDGCAGEPMVEEFEGGNCQRWSDCTDGAVVEFCTLDPMGHCWPGGDASYCFGFLGPHSDAIDATARMLDFFAEHPLP